MQKASIFKSTICTAALGLIVIFGLAGCGGNASNTSDERSQESSGVVEEKTAYEIVDGVIKVILNSNDQMQFDLEEIRVKAGVTIELTLNHTGELPKETMGHNFVLLAPGTDIATYAGKAFGAKDNDYVPEGDETIVSTKMLGGGESDTITFAAPEAGSYDFICSFPGHFGLMKGKLIVTP